MSELDYIPVSFSISFEVKNISLRLFQACLSINIIINIKEHAHTQTEEELDEPTAPIGFSAWQWLQKKGRMHLMYFLKLDVYTILNISKYYCTGNIVYNSDSMEGLPFRLITILIGNNCYFNFYVSL